LIILETNGRHHRGQRPQEISVSRRRRLAPRDELARNGHRRQALRSRSNRSPRNEGPRFEPGTRLHADDYAGAADHFRRKRVELPLGLDASGVQRDATATRILRVGTDRRQRRVIGHDDVDIRARERGAFAVETFSDVPGRRNRHENHDEVVAVCQIGVRRRADAAVDVPAAGNVGGGPEAGQRATRRDCVDQPHAARAVKGHELARLRVDGGDHQPLARPVMDWQPRGDHRSTLGLGDRRPERVHIRDPHQRGARIWCLGRQPGQLRDVRLAVEGHHDLAGLRPSLERHGLRERAGRHDGAGAGTGRCSDDEVGVGEVQPVPAEPVNHPEHPGDPGDAATSEYQCSRHRRLPSSWFSPRYAASPLRRRTPAIWTAPTDRPAHSGERTSADGTPRRR
jgi:hypothetical protein